MHNELSIIMIPTTKCNLSCSHCFEEHSNHVMSQEELRVIMQQVCEFTAMRNINGVTFYWQGGEVLLLGPDWFDKMAETVSDVFSGGETCVRHRLQSNLISYNERWRPTVQNIFQNSIGSSLDYPNLYRGFKTVTGDRFNDIWLNYCDRARADGIDVSVISVLNEQSLKIPASSFLEYYSDHMGISSLQLNFPFALRSLGDIQQSYFLSPSALGTFLVDLFNTWIDENSSWYRKIRINPFLRTNRCFFFRSAALQVQLYMEWKLR